MKKLTLLCSCALIAFTSNAQSFKEGYIEWGDFGQQFGNTVKNWTPGTELNEDDNFFISRVKPKTRFRNAATQVRTNIDETNDKRLVMWVPIDEPGENALPNGVYDSEVFNMWSYVTHYGNWTAPQGRVPGNFMDVAHKNGVAVSSVAGIPWGGLYEFPEWEQALNDQVNAGAEKTAKFLHYYGLDGLGYNSEFSGGTTIMGKIKPYHNELKEISLALNPIFENMWYDGTNENGFCTFDQGLGTHNDGVFDGASLFLNYNWNYRLASSVTYAQNNGYDPLYLYAGMNMQGAEGNYWTTLKDYPISIGLWGAHSSNMFWESRGELGSAPEVKQRTYMLRIERWFTGGSRNPVHDLPIANSMKYNAENYNFHGMSSLMSARSSLSWDLTEEPFVTYFNLGNGKFFNWKGERQHNKEWYNIGAQDYLPTWRWWFNKELVGRTTATLATNGLDAEFTWDDAYMGGSTARIFGSTDKEYLHLFKTAFDVKNGDVITFTYKLKAGSANVRLVTTAVGNETIASGKVTVCEATQEADEDIWVEKKFTVGKDIPAANVALVALEFENAQNMDLYLGEFSIVRAASAAPAKPEIKTAKILAYSKDGMDAKIVFNMANNKAAGEPCYNIDVNASMFKLYAQQEGCEPILMGVTPSWAGLYYNIPINLFAASQRVRVGVAAVSLDTKSDSEIAWSNYMSPITYVYSDDIKINKTTIKPKESFVISYVDPKHEEGRWEIYNGDGTKVAEGSGLSIEVDGLSDIGSYDLKVIGREYDANGNRVQTTREFGSYVQITSEGVGALPEIYTLTANGSSESIAIEAGDNVLMAYTGRAADGAGSQGVDLKEERFGVKCSDLGITGKTNFSVAFWLKINKLAAGETQLVAVANKLDSWPKTDWGWLWTNINEAGEIGSYTWRGSDASSNNEIQYRFANSKLPVGTWVHIAMTFEYNASGGLRGDFYINGVKQKLTSWKRTNSSENTGDPGFQSSPYYITNGQVLSVGGSAHGRNGIDGVIDNFQIWDKVMTADDVKASMNDINPSSLPSGLSAYWDLETKAGADNTFKSVGPKADISAGLHNYTATGGEGQGRFGWVESEYTSGCPFVSGTAFPVTTTPSWKTKKGVITDVAGNDTEGSANIVYNKGGDYAVTLTLANSLGSAERTFHVIKVKADDTSIDDIATEDITSYTVEGVAVVEFAQGGSYNVALYATNGQKVAAKAAKVNSGDTMQLTMGVKGVYILVIEKEGKPVRTVKLLNK